MAMRTPTEHVEAGRALVRAGRLSTLRNKLGFTRTAMADLLQLSAITYNRCEDEPRSAGAIWPSTAERLGRFHYLAEKTLTELKSEDVRLSDLMPMHVIATYHGIPQEVLWDWYRRGDIDFVDLGILGLWMYKEDLYQLDRSEW